MHHENHMARLASVPITRLARLVDDALGHFSDKAVRRELSGRRRARWARRVRPYRRLEKRVRGRFSAPDEEPVKPAPPPEPTAELFADAAAQAAARPPAPAPARAGRGAGRVRAPAARALHRQGALAEEEALFEALDVLQPRRWPELKRMLETFWGDYAATLQEGCASNGIPFVDLSGASTRAGASSTACT